MHYNLTRDIDQNPCVDSLDRGLHYGDGLFETMLLSDGKLKYWQEHYSRLSSSAKKLKIDCPEKNWFEHNLQAYIDLKQSLIVKIILTRGSGGRALNLTEKLISNVFLLKYSFNEISINQSVRAILSEITLPVNRNLAGLKHLNRLDYILATEQLKARNELNDTAFNQTDFNEAILFDTNGMVIESLVNNLFFVKDDEIYSPDLTTSGVDGIMRQLIVKKLKQSGKEVKIGNYLKNDIINSDECFLCNSVAGIRPVIQIEDKQIEIGPLTQKLQTLFNGH